MNAAAPYRLAQGVALRPERFGALVYSYDDRRLYFIHSHLAAEFVGSLDGTRPLREAVDDFVARNGLAASMGDSLLHTVGKLERMGVVKSLPSRPCE